MSAPKRLLQDEDLWPLTSVSVLAFGVAVITSLASVARAGISLPALGVHFDGYIYLEIAKSFPLPYSPRGWLYLGHAPGYPALIYLGRLLTPDTVNWGLLAVLATWIPATLSAAVFYLLCKEVEVSPLWPSVLFVLANPIWVTSTASPHAEPLAMLFVLLCVLSLLRGALAWSALWLSVATLVRFPAILVGAALAFEVLVQRRDYRVRSLLTLLLPIAVLGIYHVYLRLRVPELRLFTHVWIAHQVGWPKHFTWPFAALIENIADWPPSVIIPTFEVTYLSALLYALSVVVGFRWSERRLWILPVWAGATLVFHVCLSGATSAHELTRFMLPAWPATVLILWRWVGRSLPAAVVAALCVVAGVFGVWFTQRHINLAVHIQQQQLPFLARAISRLDSDEPDWPGKAVWAEKRVH